MLYKSNQKIQRKEKEIKILFDAMIIWIYSNTENYLNFFFDNTTKFIVGSIAGA